MRVLVGWAGELSPNLGVRALGEGSAALVRSVFADAELTFMDFGNRPAALPWGQPRSLVKERVLGRAGMMDWLGQFDMLWDTRSGDSFADIYGQARHQKMSLIHEFAVQAGARAVLAPQTLGPFTSRRGRLLARRNLHRSHLVFARDAASAAQAATLGRAVDATGTDMVFALDVPIAAQRSGVLMNVSGLLWEPNAHVDHHSYRTAVRAVIDGLLADGRDVTLFPHVLDSPVHDSDSAATAQLADEYDGALDVYVPRDLTDARERIAASELVIGARMHACLNALSTGTPAVAMAYSRKFAPLMSALQWTHVVSLTGLAGTDAGEAIGAEVLTHARRNDLLAQAGEAQSRAGALLDDVRDAVRNAAW